MAAIGPKKIIPVNVTYNRPGSVSVALYANSQDFLHVCVKDSLGNVINCDEAWEAQTFSPAVTVVRGSDPMTTPVRSRSTTGVIKTSDHATTGKIEIAIQASDFTADDTTGWIELLYIGDSDPDTVITAAMLRVSIIKNRGATL